MFHGRVGLQKSLAPTKEPSCCENAVKNAFWGLKNHFPSAKRIPAKLAKRVFTQLMLERANTTRERFLKKPKIF
jgi:hypothetical protein